MEISTKHLYWPTELETWYGLLKLKDSTLSLRLNQLHPEKYQMWNEKEKAF